VSLHPLGDAKHKTTSMPVVFTLCVFFFHRPYSVTFPVEVFRVMHCWKMWTFLRIVLPPTGVKTGHPDSGS
jgi:hypothetical protein